MFFQILCKIIFNNSGNLENSNHHLDILSFLKMALSRAEDLFGDEMPARNPLLYNS